MPSLLQTFDLTAVLDNEPELTETFSVTLLEPSLGRLDTQNIVSQITIESNEFPFGRFELVVRSDPMSSTVTVEEGIGSVEVEVQRTFGSFGTATVEWSAMGSSATDNTGKYELCVCVNVHVVCVYVWAHIATHTDILPPFSVTLTS